MAAASAVSSAFATSASGEKEVSGQPRPSLTIVQPRSDGFDAAFPRSATHTRSTKRDIDAFCLKPEATRSKAHKRSREEAEHEALAIPEPRRAKKDAHWLKAVRDRNPGSSNNVGKQEPIANGKRQPLAERPNPPAATSVTARPGGWPRITPNDALPASSGSSFLNKNGASVPGASATLPKGNALDTVLPLSSSPVGELPRPASGAPDFSWLDEEFMQVTAEWRQSDLSSLPQDGTSLAVGPPLSEEISASPAPAASPAYGVSAATELLRSGIGAQFGAARFLGSEARDPVDLGSVVPAPEEAPGVVESSAEGPVTEPWPTREEVDRSLKGLTIGTFSETPGLEMQAQPGQQAAEQQPQQSEQLQEGIWASRPAEYGQQQQAAQNLFAQLPQQASNFQHLPLTGQQGQGQVQHMPVFPATVLPQQPAPGHPYAMLQQQPPWFSHHRTADENIVHAPFWPQQVLSSCFGTYTDKDRPWNIWIHFMDPTHGHFWHNVSTGGILWGVAPFPQVPPPHFPPRQRSPQPRRGPRGGVLRGVGQPGASASAPVNFGSALVSLNPGVASTQGNGPLAAGSGGPAPAMTQEQPSEEILVDPALLATPILPGEEVFRPMMSGALQ